MAVPGAVGEALYAMGHEQLIVTIYAVVLSGNPAIMANPTAFAAQVNIANFGPAQIKAMVAAQVRARPAAAPMPATGVSEPAGAAAPAAEAAAVAEPTPSKLDSGDLATNLLKGVAAVTPERVLATVRAMSTGLSFGKGVELDNFAKALGIPLMQVNSEERISAEDVRAKAAELGIAANEHGYVSTSDVVRLSAELMTANRAASIMAAVSATVQSVLEAAFDLENGPVSVILRAKGCPPLVLSLVRRVVVRIKASIVELVRGGLLSLLGRVVSAFKRADTDRSGKLDREEAIAALVPLMEDLFRDPSDLVPPELKRTLNVISGLLKATRDSGAAEAATEAAAAPAVEAPSGGPAGGPGAAATDAPTAGAASGAAAVAAPAATPELAPTLISTPSVAADRLLRTRTLVSQLLDLADVDGDGTIDVFEWVFFIMPALAQSYMLRQVLFGVMTKMVSALTRFVPRFLDLFTDLLVDTFDGITDSLKSDAILDSTAEGAVTGASNERATEAAAAGAGVAAAEDSLTECTTQ